MTGNRFPREDFSTLVSHLPSYARLAWRLGRDRRLSRRRRVAIVGAAVYLVSPIDLVPGVVPIAGQLDDIFVALTALRFALGGLSNEQQRQHLDAVGLSDADLRSDFQTTRRTAAWIARGAASLASATSRRAAHALVAGVRAALRLGRRR